MPLPLAIAPSALPAASVASRGFAPSAARKQSFVIGALAGVAAIGAIAALTAWLVWNQFDAESRIDATPVSDAAPNAAPPRKARSPRPERFGAAESRGSTAGQTTTAAGQAHRSADGEIEFWLPAGAKSETRRSFGTSAGLADRTRVTWSDRKTGQLVGTVYLYRGSHDDLAADTEMKVEMLKGLYNAYQSRVSQSYREITHGEFTGTEADIQVTGERDNTFRFLYKGDYLVTLEAIGPPGFAASAPAKKFFNSLRMVDGK
jgi:hypothetical protein